MKGFERFKGPSFAAAEDGYDEERTGFNLACPHRPEVVAGATCPEDVVEAVRYAAARGLPVAVQATGHGQREHLEGGVLVTTGRMRGLRVDPAARTARVEAGVRSGEVVAAAAAHGLAPRNGSSPSVGVVGYTLAGGLGLLGRSLGWAADHVRAFEVVTPEGRLARVPAAGPLDVVTAMEIELVPLTVVFGGALTFDGADAPAVLDAWREWTRKAPPEATSSLAMVRMPDIPAIPQALRGRDTVSVRLAMLGDRAAGSTLAAPLRAAAPALVDTLRMLPWTDSATIASDPPGPHPYQGTGVLLSSLDHEALGTILRAAGPGAPVDTVVQLNHLGGALAEPPAVPNAAGHREAAYLLRLLSVVGPAGGSPIEQSHEAFVTALGERVLGRSRAFQFTPFRKRREKPAWRRR